MPSSASESRRRSPRKRRSTARSAAGNARPAPSRSARFASRSTAGLSARGQQRRGDRRVAAELDLRQPELRVLLGDEQVAGERELEAAAEREAADCGDRHALAARDRADRGVKVLEHARRGLRHVIGDLDAGRKRARRTARDHDRGDRVRSREPVQRFRKPAARRAIQHVERRPVEPDARHRAGALDLDAAHRRPAARAARPLIGRPPASSPGAPPSRDARRCPPRRTRAASRAPGRASIRSTRAPARARRAS